jgi:hypothetical protein
LNIFLFSQFAYADDTIVSTDSIKIDGHWIYIFQQDDIRTFRIDEYFFINNTGTTFFNDSIGVWIQNDSSILTDFCEGILNPGCRYGQEGCMLCFTLNNVGDNTYVGYPISEENKLSYYGQKESMILTASNIDNSQDNDTLLLNVTIGGLSISRDKEIFQETGIHITSESIDIGMRPLVGVNMPYNITTAEKVTVFNNNTDSKVVEFSLSNLPQDWTLRIWNDTEQVNNVSIDSKEYYNLTLVITAPSYIAPIYVGYNVEVLKDEQYSGIFTKRYLYNTSKVQYLIYSLSKEGLDISQDLTFVHPFPGEDPSWNEDYERYWYVVQAIDIKPDSFSTLNIRFNETSEEFNFLIALIIIIAVIFFVIVFVAKKKDVKEKKFTKENESDIAETKKENEEKRKELKKQKNKILETIKRVDNEFKEGIITKDNYEKIRASYKKQAVEILKEIDRLKEE